MKLAQLDSDLFVISGILKLTGVLFYVLKTVG